MTDQDRFMSNVRKGVGCWPWTGRLRGSGYGAIRFRGRTMIAHRVAWILFRGEIPEGKGYHGTCVLHRCDNRACVNPDHLFLGTQQDNVNDAVSKGRAFVPVGGEEFQRQKTHCPQGHPYDGSNLSLSKDGKRVCKACVRQRSLDWWRRNVGPKTARRRRRLKNDSFLCHPGDVVK